MWKNVLHYFLFGLAIAVGAAALIIAPLMLAAPANASQGPSRPVLGWTTGTVEEVDRVERRLGVRPAILSAYTDFRAGFPDRWAAEARERSVPLLLALEPWDASRGYTDQPEYSYDQVSAGVHDDYLRELARDVREAEITVFIRFAPEMNGDWQVWHKGDTPDGFISAWRHVHEIFADEQVANVKWVWNPNNHFEGATPYSDYWPGAEYVDWVAVDGYNWEGVLPGRSFESADTVFGESIRLMREVAPGKPIMIAESGSGPASKFEWFKSLAETAPALGVGMVVWFEHDKETDWRLSVMKGRGKVFNILKNTGWRVARPA